MTPWLNICCRTLLVGLYHLGLVEPYRREQAR